MPLKDDCEKRPIVVTPEGVIYLETFGKLYRIAYEFLICIAEPINRPSMMHVYKINKYSLYTAMVLHYDPDNILRILDILAKN